MDEARGKAVAVGLANLPPELLQRIGVVCDVNSLSTLCMTCKILNFVLSDEVVWKQKWHQICRHYNLVASDIDLLKTNYQAACLRSASCFYDGIFQNDVEAMTCPGVGLGWSPVRNAMAFDCGSKTARIAWFDDYFRSSCPAVTAHLKVKCYCLSLNPSVKQCTCQSLSMAELNDRLKTHGHPTVSQPVVVGKKAKLLLGQFPDLYQRDDYPIYYSQVFPPKTQQLQQVVRIGAHGEPRLFTSSESSTSSMDTTSSLSPNIHAAGTSKSSELQLSVDNPDQCMHKANLAGAMQNSNNASSLCAENVGKKPQVYFKVCTPVKDGDIVDLQNYELLLRHLHSNITGRSQQLAHMRDISRTAYLLCEPPRCSHATRKALLKLMFEKLKVSRICLQNKAVLLCMEPSYSTCLVIDSGASSTVVTPIIDSIIQQDAVQFKPVGGLQVALALADTITSKGLVDEVLVDSLDDRVIKEECLLAYQPSFAMKKCFATKNILVPRPSCCVASPAPFPHPHSTSHQDPVASMAKSIGCGVTLVPRVDECRGRPSFSNIPFGSERFLACEDMYRKLDLPTMVATALERCQQDAHTHLLSRIILTGGNSSLKGFAQRLARDLKERLPPRYTEVIMVSKFDDIFTWLTLLGPGLDGRRWITRAEYVFEGERVLDRYQEAGSHAMHDGLSS